MKIEIFEKALCCETGVCGGEVDTELLRITAQVAQLKAAGVDIDRANLSTLPQRFIENTLVAGLLGQHGVEILPVTLVDGVVFKEKAYPTDAELEKLTGVKLAKKSGCCCKKGCC